MLVEKKTGSFRSIFMHADTLDWIFMILGTFGAIGDGFTTPLTLYIMSGVMNNIGDASKKTPTAFIQTVDKVIHLSLSLSLYIYIYIYIYIYGNLNSHICRVAYWVYVMINLMQYSLALSYLATASFFASFLGQFVGSNIVAFALFWRLAVVGFPFVVLLLIPGLIYGKTMMRLARKIREESNKAGTIAEQAISSIRIVYSFVGESKTIEAFSNALQGSVKLGLRQGLTKGLAIGCNGVVFSIWAVMCYYGSRLVMYHGAKGGTVFAVGSAICYCGS
ncbi:hypothetical protein Fmac_016803 [Flemingia macrophylla]|uniref:ABC transmembrane type-1 domain-containing protein n=1 Tax=Flemingia macrophylla TaxID=520843 RepID=A0ABD1MIH2_9FABA